MTALAKTVAKHGDKCAFVSTINRQSSAMFSYGGTYAETIVWEYDETTKTRGKVLFQDEACTDSLHAHEAAVARFEQYGTFEEIEE